MRAVWSFWSKPYFSQKGGKWLSHYHHLLGWGLSLSSAARHYPDTVLITDKPGKSLLVDKLGLPFKEVSTELEQLNQADPGWWALGKLLAYTLQNQPFVHIDTDVFLWKPLPEILLQAPVFAQCPERHPLDEWRNPQEIAQVFERCHLPLPVEWVWSISRELDYFREECCGIIGGSNTGFIQHYARTALDIILNPRFQPAWRHYPDRTALINRLEQFFLATCVDYHRFNPNSPYRGVRIHYVFDSWEDAFKPQLSSKAGFTHVLSTSKAHPLVSRRLEQRMQRDDPGYFRQCQKVAENMA